MITLPLVDRRRLLAFWAGRPAELPSGVRELFTSGKVLTAPAHTCPHNCCLSSPATVSRLVISDGEHYAHFADKKTRASGRLCDLWGDHSQCAEANPAFKFLSPGLPPIPLVSIRTRDLS